MEKNTYIVAVYAIGQNESFDISKEEFVEIKEARAFTIFGQSIEEKFDLLLENYAELEREVIDMSVQHSIFNGSIEVLLNEGMHRINRRLINLLTATKLYHDQVAHSLSMVYGNKNKVVEQLRVFSRAEYDNHLGYRVIEALRNHVQHASLPVTSISFPMRRVKPTLSDIDTIDKHLISFNVIPSIGLKELETNKKFKKSVLMEMNTISDKDNKIQLIPMIREYIECIGRVHSSLRTTCKVELEKSSNLLENYRKKSEQILGKNTAGLCAIERDPSGHYSDKVYLNGLATKRWEALQAKNCRLEFIANRFVTSEYIRYDT